MENVGQGRIPWESLRENKKSSEEQMKRKTSIRYKTTHEGNGEISGLKMKGFGMERNGAQGNFQVEDESKLSSSAGFLSSIST